MSVIAVGPAVAIAGAGYRRWATYRQAAIAGVFVNTVFGVIKLSILLGIADSAGGTVAGYDAASLSTYAWVWVVVGIVLIGASFAVLNRSQFARWIGIIAGGLLAISAMWWMPFYPVWSLAYVAIGVLVVYALAVHGGRVAR